MDLIRCNATNPANCKWITLTFEDEVENVKQILYDRSDICTLEIPNPDGLYSYIDTLIDRENNFIQSLYEVDDYICNTELAAIEKCIDDAIEYIRSIQDINMRSYQAYSLSYLDIYNTCQYDYIDMKNYMSDNAGLILAAYDMYIDVNTEVLSDKRINEGVERMFHGGGLLLLGISILAAETMLPEKLLELYYIWKASGVVTSVTGGLDIIEGGQDTIYGLKQDIETPSINVLKDTIGEELYYNIEKYSTIIGATGLAIHDALQLINGIKEAWAEAEALDIAGLEGAEAAEINVLQNVEGGNGTNVAQYGDEFGKMGTYVENPKIKVDWTQYTEHAVERMQQRGMTQELIDYIVENGKVLSQNGGNKYVFITKEGVAVVSKEGKLITGWTCLDYDEVMIEIVNKLFGE